MLAEVEEVVMSVLACADVAIAGVLRHNEEPSEFCHVEVPAVVLEPWEISNLYWLAADDDDALSLSSRLVLVTMVDCVRHRHFERTTACEGPAGLAFCCPSPGASDQ